MKVCVIGTRGFPDVLGGIETHCQQLYPRLTAAGADVTVFTRTPYLEKPYRREWQGIKFANLPCPRTKSLEAVTHTLLAVLAARWRSPDIVHVHAVGPSLLVPLARLMGLKVVMTHHGPDYQRAKWGRLAKVALKLGERMGCTFAHEVIAISDGITRQVKDKFGRQAKLIPNGVEIPEPSSHTTYLKSQNLQPGRYVLSMARFVPEKGLHHLVDAFATINTDWKLVIAGDADHETAYSRKLKDQARQTKNVILTGFVNGQPWRELYSHAGLFVLPSYYEGLPIALLEALSFGLSVLVSDIPQNREVQLDDDRYYPVQNRRELAGKLEYWINKGPLTDRERKQQLDRVRRRYDWNTVAQRVLEVYTTLVPTSNF